MPGKTPKNNGNEPIENDIRSKGDVEMKDSGKAKGKKGAKEVDEEMTVVVPITKLSKQSSKQPQDDDGDVSMDVDDISDDGDKVDPAVQTVAGMTSTSLCKFSLNAQNALRPRFGAIRKDDEGFFHVHVSLTSEFPWSK